MALAMPSRFAVLKIEDDDFRPPNPNKTKEKKKGEVKSNGKKPEKTVTSATALKKPTKKKDKKKKESPEQWEQWKVKDSELVEGNYEQDLHNAILLSKLDYEEKKTIYKQTKKEVDQDKKGNEKKKKSKSMSLEQFNTMVDGNQDTKGNGDAEEIVVQDFESDAQFFDRINATTKEVITKEHRNEKVQKAEPKKVQKSFNNETITIAQMQEKLDLLLTENTTLRDELDKSKKEILAVKSRNKTLCGILAHGEMKDKADVLMELDKLSRVRDELTEEVTRLHGLLEQERSKVGVLTSAEPHNTHNTHGKKEKHRKKTADLLIYLEQKAARK